VEPGIQSLQQAFDLNPELQSRLLASFVVLLLLWVLRQFTVHVVNRQTTDVATQYRWRKVSTYLVGLAGLFLVGRIWVPGMRSLATFLGLVSAGLAIALQDPVANLAGWAFIMWRRPFGVGDRIQIGDHAGDVIDVRIFQFTLLEIGNWVDADQSTGRILHVPNRSVFTQVLANYSRGFAYIWNEIPVLVTFESNWQKAKSILQAVADEHAGDMDTAVRERVQQAARRFMIFYPTLTPTVYTRVCASGVELTIRYLCKPRRRRATEQAIWEDVLRAFAQHRDIEFAYPTQRFYARWREEVPADGRAPAEDPAVPMARED
jgi:small-conductance mechanosensitive channel